jgi:hypothetical protein
VLQRQLICPPLMKRVVTQALRHCNISVTIAGQTAAQTRRVDESRRNGPIKVADYRHFLVILW